MLFLLLVFNVLTSEQCGSFLNFCSTNGKSKSQSQKSQGKTNQKVLVLESLLCLWHHGTVGHCLTLQVVSRNLSKPFLHAPFADCFVFFTSISVDYAIFSLFVLGEFVWDSSTLNRKVLLPFPRSSYTVCLMPNTAEIGSFNWGHTPGLQFNVFQHFSALCCMPTCNILVSIPPLMHVTQQFVLF